MSERQALLKRVQACDFALVDAGLYLDTHPDDALAQDYYKKHLQLKKEACAEYTRKYGPLMQEEYEGGAWKWVEGPWPWQNEEA